MQGSDHGQKVPQKVLPPSSSIISSLSISKTKTQNESQTLFSEQKSRMDYVTLNGIRDRTGFEKEDLHLLVLKELLDNAVDYLEKNYVGSKEIPEVKVFITVRKSADNKDYLTFKVDNSNNRHPDVAAGRTSDITIEMLTSIFNFDSFFSSKRNQYKITRGALGDALKEVICVPYALAKEYNNIEWNRPLVITTGNHRFLVSLKVDRINQRIDTEIIRKNHVTTNATYTEIEIHVPIIDKTNCVVENLESFLLNYAIFNTHISFHFEILDQRQDTEPRVFDFPQLQKVTVNWKNATTSIYYYTYQEFEQFVFGLQDNNMLAYDALQIFRECSNLKKDHTLTVGELKHNQDKIYQIYTKLHQVMKPKTKLDLQFDISSKVRSEAIRTAIEDTIGTVSRIKYRAQHGYYKSSGGDNINNNIEFPFVFEFAIIQTEREGDDDLDYYMRYINAINSSPHDYSFLAGNRSDTFRWSSRSSNNENYKNKKINTASNIFQILDKYGYSYYKERCKKPNTTIFVNLISPMIDYKSYGKSYINLEPFAETVAETVYKTCSLTGGGRSTGLLDEKYTIRDLLIELLEDRNQEIQQDHTLKDRDRWTQSTVFYRLRPILLGLGYSAEEIGRKRPYITKMIRPVCEEELGIKREELGIFAADRAQLYFNGAWYDVGFNELNKLMHNGTDLLIIEKEGVAEVLTPFAYKRGIAFLNTRGFLTEYASMLSELSAKHGCNVVILSDFDVSGLYLAEKVPNGVYRIGIDFDTIEYFGLSVEDVAEKYEANNNHLKPLIEMAIYDISLYDKLRFLKHKRIEIDSIIAKVGSEMFWEFVEHKLSERFPTRNYNRAIDIPEFVYPHIVEVMLEQLQKILAVTVKQERQCIENELSNISGFLDPQEKEQEVESRLKDTITDVNKKDIQPILKKVKELLVVIKRREEKAN